MLRTVVPLTAKCSFNQHWQLRYQFNNPSRRVYETGKSKADNLHKTYGKQRKNEKKLSGRRPSTSEQANPLGVQYLLNIRLLSKSRQWAEANSLLQEAKKRGSSFSETPHSIFLVCLSFFFQESHLFCHSLMLPFMLVRLHVKWI